MPRATTASREFTGRHMLASVVGFFAVIIGVNLTMAYFANATWSGLVVANGYVASQSFDKDLARVRAQEALGWTVAVDHDHDGVGVTFLDRMGRPLAGMAVTGMLRRPTTDRQDQALVFSDAGAGRYRASAGLNKGVWDVEVDAASADGTAWHKTYRFIAAE